MWSQNFVNGPAEVQNGCHIQKLGDHHYVSVVGSVLFVESLVDDRLEHDAGQKGHVHYGGESDIDIPEQLHFR